jgi:hypothetical protein
VPSSAATSSASCGWARPLKTIRFFSVVRFNPLTLRYFLEAGAGMS